ncbi:hypothetical protein CR513_12487, partial [Mucuna pruriens]
MNIITKWCSCANFFSNSNDPAKGTSKAYGPINELLEENPPIYKDTTIEEIMTHHFAKGLDDNFLALWVMQDASGVYHRLLYIHRGKGSIKELGKFVVNKAKKLEGLHADQFSDSLALRRPSIVEEIKARVEKHIKVEENLADQLEAEHEMPPALIKNSQGYLGRVNPQGEENYKQGNDITQFIPLKARRSQILRGISHTLAGYTPSN